MENLAKYFRFQVALALIGFGIQHFIVKNFTIGEPLPFSASIPGCVIWAYFTGALLILSGILILLNKNATPLLIVAGIIIFIWGFGRELPGYIKHPVLNAYLTIMGESLAMTGCCFIVANSPRVKLGVVGAIFIGIFLLICGILHFIITKLVQSMVPSWLPFSLFWTYFAGVALILSGGGLMLPRTRKQAALWSGLMIFIWMLIIHIPRVVHSIHDEGEWNSLLQTLALSGALFVVAFNQPMQNSRS